MGTNFYVRGFRHSDDPEYHLGKRSAAGVYCWDCRITLCKGGEDGIHMGKSDWHDGCPKCGATRSNESLENNTAGRELGFNKNAPETKTGVKSCCSFGWAMPTVNFNRLMESKCASHNCPSCDRKYDDPEKIIEDEYGRTYTKEEFEDVLAECPVRFWNHVGQYFC